MAKSKAKVFHEVLCQVHGTKITKGNPSWARYLVVSTPRSKAVRLYSGCPLCKKEHIQE